MEPLVSILIPAFNAERWIADTIRSALAQTWTRKEIIIVDDGSRDRTLAVAQQFASRNVLVVTQPNEGAAAARNKAYQLCQGDHIQWLDADDLLSLDKIERQLALVLAGKVTKSTLLSAEWAHFRYRTSVAKFHGTALWCDLSPVEWLVRRWEDNLHMQTATWLISRELTEFAGPWDTRLLSNDDGEYLCRIMKFCDAIKFVSAARVFYRITGSERLSYVGQSKKKMEAQLLGLQLQIQHVLSLDNSDRTRSACLKRLQMWFDNSYPQDPKLMSQVEQLANSFGGVLQSPPRLSRKYAWVQKLFGWTAARMVRRYYNEAKSGMAGFYDAMLFYLESFLGQSKQLGTPTANAYVGSDSAC